MSLHIRCGQEAKYFLPTDGARVYVGRINIRDKPGLFEGEELDEDFFLREVPSFIKGLAIYEERDGKLYPVLIIPVGDELYRNLERVAPASGEKGNLIFEKRNGSWYVKIHKPLELISKEGIKSCESGEEIELEHKDKLVLQIPAFEKPKEKRTIGDYMFGDLIRALEGLEKRQKKKELKMEVLLEIEFSVRPSKLDLEEEVED